VQSLLLSIGKQANGKRIPGPPDGRGTKKANWHSHGRHQVTALYRKLRTSVRSSVCRSVPMEQAKGSPATRSIGCCASNTIRQKAKDSPPQAYTDACNSGGDNSVLTKHG